MGVVVCVTYWRMPGMIYRAQETPLCLGRWGKGESRGPRRLGLGLFPLEERVRR